jgi:STAM-binding protein
MSDDQRRQGYTPSLQSMFSTSITSPPPTGLTGGLLFSPNHPEGPSVRNMPTSPDRPPAHIRHMWEKAGYGFQPEPLKPSLRPAQHDSRILRPEDVRERDETVFPSELKIVTVPQDVIPRFLNVAAVNTARNRETCGLLMGREDKKQYRVLTLLIPKQRATSDTCTMEEEELVSEFTEKRNMITLGWVSRSRFGALVTD